jgi:hypothetical protein
VRDLAGQQVVAPASLVDKLWVLRDEFRRRHPDTKFDGAVVAVISREAPYGRSFRSCAPCTTPAFRIRSLRSRDGDQPVRRCEGLTRPAEAAGH